MHILHCLTHSTDGGGQAIPYLIIKSFNKYFPHVKHTVVLPNNGVYVQRFQQLGIPAKTFPLNRVSVLSFFSVLKLLKQLNPDIIHSNGRGAGIYTRVLSQILLNKKVIHTHHGFHVPGNFFSKFIFTLIERIQISGTSITIAVSESEKREIQKLLFLKDERVVCINNIVDCDEVILRAEESLDDISEKFINSKYPFTIVMIGRDDPVKNYSLAYSTAHFVLKQEETSAFYFVGAGSSPTLEALVSDYPERVFQIPLRKNPLPILKQASILLITSRREGGPLVILEAFALGKPVIGTNVRGINDYVRHGENGILTTEEPNQLASAILSVINDSDLLKELSLGAKNSVGTDTLETWSKRYYKLYDSLM